MPVIRDTAPVVWLELMMRERSTPWTPRAVVGAPRSAARCRRLLQWVNLRREPFVRASPLFSTLPPRQRHSRAAGMRHQRAFASRPRQRGAGSYEGLLDRLQAIDFCAAQPRRQSGGLSIRGRSRWGRRALPGGRRARRSRPCFLLETAQQFAKAIGKRLAEDLAIESAQPQSNSLPDFVPTRRSRTHPKVSWSAMFDLLRLTRVCGDNGDRS